MEPRLHTVGVSLRDKAIAALNAPRVTNTARRANMADGAIARAEKDRAIGEACIRIAAMGDGPLAAVKCLAHVRFLESLVARSRSRNAAKLNKRFEEVTDEEGAELAVRPAFRILLEHLVRAARDSEADTGPNPVSAVLHAAVGRLAGKDWVELDVHVNRAVLRMFREGKVAAWVPDAFREAAAEQKHLDQLGVTTDAELRALLLAYVAAKAGTAPVDSQTLRIRKLERELVGAKIPGYFPTPRPACERVVELARIEPGMFVLEPSAGKGDLAETARELGRTCRVFCVERQHSLFMVLLEKGLVTHHGDFLQVRLELFLGWSDVEDKAGWRGFHRVVMNPPFEDGADMTHVQHAFGMLRPGGRLVSIMSEGCFFREDRRAVAFRTWLDELGAESEHLAAGTFNRSDVTQRTNVATRIVVIDKPRTS